MQQAKYKYAGYWPRMWAYNTDLVILLAIFYLLSWIIEADNILYWVCFVTTVIYHAAFESSSWQATPGKMILKIRVISMEGGTISFGKGILRFLLKIVSLVVLYIGFIMIGFTKKGQGLHDKIINTLVINNDEQPSGL